MARNIPKALSMRRQQLLNVAGHSMALAGEL
jgi:hypothetical protein